MKLEILFDFQKRWDYRQQISKFKKKRFKNLIKKMIFFVATVEPSPDLSLVIYFSCFLVTFFFNIFCLFDHQLSIIFHCAVYIRTHNPWRSTPLPSVFMCCTYKRRWMLLQTCRRIFKKKKINKNPLATLYFLMHANYLPREQRRSSFKCVCVCLFLSFYFIWN